MKLVCWASCCDNKNSDSISSTAEYDTNAYLDENFPMNFMKSLAKLVKNIFNHHHHNIVFQSGHTLHRIYHAR